MNKKFALQIAYNILNDELACIKEEDIGYGYDEEYYQEIKDAIKTIKEMIKEME